jgi:hypothetical protein
MSDLTNTEKRKLEKLLDMGGGYVLTFSNRTLDEFVVDSIGRSIYDSRYTFGSGSKANQIRGVWKVESNHIVGKLMGDLLDYAVEIGSIVKASQAYEDCNHIVQRLKESSSVSDLDALTALSEEKDFEIVAKAVRGAIDENSPETGLDRLHTFVTKYLRSLCTLRGVTVTRDKPLHSLIGEYVKKLRELGHIESEMTLRILKTSISNLDAFNDVRNNQSLAHDNPILNYDESLLIFNNVVSSIRFLRSLEERIEREKTAAAQAPDNSLISDDDVPF